MQYIFKLIVAASIIARLIQRSKTGPKEILLFLLLISISLLVGELRGKWSLPSFAAELIVGSFAMMQGLSFGALVLIAFDLMYYKKVFLYVFLFVICLLLEEHPLRLFYENSLPISLAIYAGYVLRTFEERNLFFRSVLDSERRSRYELESIKTQLVNTNKEIERLTEVKERNRIARDLHDSLGHSIAGVLFQLQAGIKLLKKDEEKSEKILQSCVVNLQNALSNIRDTVHNMYSHEKMGLNHIKLILSNYTFCEIISKIEGDFSGIPVQFMEGITWVTKEALTNTSKHSKASQIYFELICKQKVLRLFIHDNGRASSRFVEGLGIKSMRDRIEAFGGILSVDRVDGMRIVCTIPLEGR